MNEIRLRECEPSDTVERMRLFHAAFPEVQNQSTGSIDHYHWKFRTFPHSPNSYEYCGSYDQGLASYYAALPFRYLIAGSPATAGMVCDVMTHPQFQGKGLFTQIGRYATNQLQNHGLDFTTGYPIRKEVIPGHIKVGWSRAFYLPLYLKVIGLNSFLSKIKAPRLPESFAKLLRWILSASWRNPAFTVILSRNLIAQTDKIEAVAAFFKKYGEQKNCYLIKDSPFLKWRLSAPDAEYAIIALPDFSSSLKAVGIVRSTELSGVKTLAILDAAALNPNSYDQLHQAIAKWAYSENVDAIAIMCSPNSFKELRLARQIFLPSGLKFLLIIKNLSQKFKDAVLLDEKNWSLFWMDSDDL